MPHDPEYFHMSEPVETAPGPPLDVRSGANASSVDSTLEMGGFKETAIDDLTTDNARVSQTAIRFLTVKSGTFEQSAALRLHAEEVALHNSSAGILSTDRADVFDSAVGILRGPMTVREGKAQVLLHIGPADCTVRPIMSGRTAIAVGAGLGAAFAVLGTLLRRILTDGTRS
jgi:hypothetical protein